MVIVGGDETSYGGPPGDARNWREKLLAEVRIDPTRVHFVGRVPYQYYLSVLQISRVHTYLTYPFVLSWSMLSRCRPDAVLVGSATPPVQEVLEDGVNGALVDYFDGAALLERVCSLLEDADTNERYRAAARDYAVRNHDLKSVCLPKQIALIERVASRNLPSFSSSAAADGFPGAPRRRR